MSAEAVTAADTLTAAYAHGRRLARRVAGNPVDGDDLLQDAMCRLWTVRARYPADELPHLLYRTIINLQRDRARRSRRVSAFPFPDRWLGRESRLDEDEPPVPPTLVDDESPERLVLQTDYRRRLRALLAAMSAADQAVLVGQYWHGMPMTDLRLKSRARRARARLRVAWETAA